MICRDLSRIYERKEYPYRSPSVFFTSYKIPHSLLSSRPLIDNLGVGMVQMPVGFCNSLSSSCIRYSGMAVACIWPKNVKGQRVFGVSSVKGLMTIVYDLSS